MALRASVDADASRSLVAVNAPHTAAVLISDARAASGARSASDNRAETVGGVVAQRWGVGLAIERSRVRLPARARLRTTTLGKLFTPSCLDADTRR